MISEMDFESALGYCQDPQNQRVILYFEDPTLPVCQTYLETITSLTVSELSVCRVDVRLEPELQIRFPQGELPVTYFYSNGLSLGRKERFRSGRDLENWLKLLDGLC
jgi:thioredoxin-like negative regulator of GroEL